MKKVWYKRPSYWIWICSVLAVLLVLINVATFYVVHRTCYPSTSTASIENTDTTSKSDKDTVTVNHKAYKYTKRNSPLTKVITRGAMLILNLIRLRFTN